MGMVKKLTCLLLEGHRRHLYYDRIAEFLFANGVTIPVRCKDCKYQTTGLCPMENIEVPWVGTKDYDFCSFGERKDNDL